jgi:ADP-ribose pyrophosphatase
MAVKEYTVERDGVGATYSSIDRPDSIIVIPLTPTNRTVLLEQYRFPTAESSWELPMGTVDTGESAVGAARRELGEEVGLRVTGLIEIAAYRPAPGLTGQKVTVFLCRVSEEALDAAVASPTKADEIQNVCIVTLDKLHAMITEGSITDGFSLAGFLLLHVWLQRHA